MMSDWQNVSLDQALDINDRSLRTNPEWSVMDLGEVAEVIAGQSPEGRYYNEDGEGMPFYQGKIEFTDLYINKPRKWTTQVTRTAKPGDILMSVRAPAGPVNLCRIDCCIGRGLAAIRSRNENTAIQAYLFYFLRSQEKNIVGTPGSVFASINKKDIGKIKISLPPLREQRAIAAVLGALDDKIELNRRMNETLEATARTIFRDWFVDFGPVRAKMEGRPPYLASDLWSLFPDTFNDGGIPKGWNMVDLDQEFNLLMGQSPPGDTYNESQIGIPFFQGIRDFGFRYPQNRVFCSAPARLADRGDTLVSVRAPVGEVNMAMERSCIGRGVASVRHKSTSRSYTYYWMKSLRDQFKVHEAGGTVFGSINKADFSKIKVLQLNPKLSEEFENICFPLDQEIETLTSQTQTLATIRDFLLPRLMSGEVRVGEVAEQVERAT